MSPDGEESEAADTQNSSNTINSIKVDVDVDKNLGAIIRDLILKEEIPEPLIFRKIHQDWEPCTWSLKEWGDLFKNEKMSMRYGQLNWDKEHPQWESECGKIDLTWRELMDWMNEQFVFLNKNGSPKDIWVYYDYKYLPDVFHMKSPDEKDFLKLIYFIENLKNKFCWSKLGFPERNGDQTTLWIGTKGAYTPGHFDTYSCNLVSQVYGKKTWLLFPPEDMKYLQPTRIPYEESSVYSRINFSSPKGTSTYIDDLKKCHPLRVTLEPGDCLYLPPKWWHFVSSEDFSISVNTWIELPSDHSIRMEESVLRSIVASVVNVTYPETTIKILNPNEMDLTEYNETDLNDLLQQTAMACLQDGKNRDPCSSKNVDTSTSDSVENNGSQSTCGVKVEESDSENAQPPRKRTKLSFSVSFEELLVRSSAVEKLPSYSFESFDIAMAADSPRPSTSTNEDAVGSQQGSENAETEQKIVTTEENVSPTYLDHLINAIGHPEVLKHISTQLLKNVALNPPIKKKH